MVWTCSQGDTETPCSSMQTHPFSSLPLSWDPLREPCPLVPYLLVFFFGIGTTLPIAPHHVAPQRLPQPLFLYASHLLTSRPCFREVHHL